MVAMNSNNFAIRQHQVFPGQAELRNFVITFTKRRLE